MRFMIIVKEGTDEGSASASDDEMFDGMSRFNEQLVDSGVMLAGEGLHPSSEATNVEFVDGRPVVSEGGSSGPDTVAGYWVWDVSSKEEALEWIRRSPFGSGARLEIRQLMELEDFGDEVTPEVREAEERMREKLLDRMCTVSS